MTLYEGRNYLTGPTEAEIKEYNRICDEEQIEGMHYGKRNLYRKYPEAIRHYNSLFPNNHIDLFDWQNSGNMEKLIDEFAAIVHDENSQERDILRFINHRPAHFIIGSLLTYKDFGHHKAYIFPEFSIGNGIYYADYLIIGKNSGGYEFLFVELEAPNGRTTRKNGHEGLATRKGLEQIDDWKYMIDKDFDAISKELKKHSNKVDLFPNELLNYDSTRMHYTVICGTRDDYNDVTYRDRRAKKKEMHIDLYHYDNLIDISRNLIDRVTF